MDETKQPGIRISHIFIARSHFEHTANAAELPPNTPVGEMPLAVNVGVGVNPEGTVGIVSVTVATQPESKALYRLLVEMVGIIEAGSDSNMSLRDYVTKAGPPTLYPFVREAVASMTQRGRFGAIWIPPFNFAAITNELAQSASAETGTEAGQ